VADRFIRAGFPTDRTMVLPYFCPIPVAAAPARHDHQPTMLFIGRVRETKGVECFVRALGLMASDVRGLIVGDASPKQLADLRAIATASNCAQRLEIRPWASRDQLREIYAQATIFAFPSIWPETLGIVGLEALASGVPVVASHIGGVREWLIDGQTGLLVPPNDPKSLADAASRLIAAPQLREAMGRNGTALIRSRFSPAAHVVNLIDLYERAQAAGPATLVAA
jgi:glycosyltransferase involved in cell wall biosynthesis